MKHIIFALALVLALAGCQSTANKMMQSAGGKNINLDGFLSMSEIEMSNPETATPTGKMIVGRVSYKSRKVGIPADQKVPTTGNYKATKTKSIFGTEEQIIEYDFTAGSDAEAARALEQLEKIKKESAAQTTAETPSK
jgi:hypothetical protein